MTDDTQYTLNFDPDHYRHHLDGMDISEEEAQQLMAALWHIMQTFVDIGWGVDAVQQIFPDLFEKTSTEHETTLQQTLHQTFDHASEYTPEQK